MFEVKLWFDSRRFWLRQIPGEEKERFNTFLLSSETGNIFQSYDWGQFKSLTGWKAAHVLLEDRDRVYAAATILKKSSAGLHFFYSPRGPVMDNRSPGLLALFSRGVTALAQQEKAAFWRIDPELTGSHPTNEFMRAGFVPVEAQNSFGGIQPKWVWRIPLENNTDVQWNMLKKSCRRQIKKAQNSGISIREAGAKDLPDVYKLLSATAARNGFLLRDCNYYEALWQQFALGSNMKTLLACLGQEPVSTAIAIGFGAGVWDIYAGNADKAGETGASYLLTWELIKWACNAGYRFYDLGGIVPNAPDDDPIAGLRFFKSRFGGVEVEFIGEFDLVFRPGQYRICQQGQKSFELLKRLRKKLKS